MCNPTEEADHVRHPALSERPGASIPPWCPPSWSTSWSTSSWSRNLWSHPSSSAPSMGEHDQREKAETLFNGEYVTAPGPMARGAPGPEWSDDTESRPIDNATTSFFGAATNGMLTSAGGCNVRLISHTPPGWSDATATTTVPIPLLPSSSASCLSAPSPMPSSFARSDDGDCDGSRLTSCYQTVTPTSGHPWTPHASARRDATGP